MAFVSVPVVVWPEFSLELFCARPFLPRSEVALSPVPSDWPTISSGTVITTTADEQRDQPRGQTTTPTAIRGGFETGRRLAIDAHRAGAPGRPASGAGTR